MKGLADRLWHWLDAWRERQGLQTTPANFPWAQSTGRLLLHVGCGPARKEHTTPGFQSPDWQEVRLDIDPAVEPDILASMLDMRAVPDAAVDAVFTSHTLEHLYHHEVPQAIAEIMRVLKPDGFVVCRIPDLQQAASMIAEGRLFETAYLSAAGPVTPFDVVYSHRAFVGRDRPYMAHHCGFTAASLTTAFSEADFPSVITHASHFELWALAGLQPMTETELRLRAAEHFPA